jgi:hypothetical protein
MPTVNLSALAGAGQQFFTDSGVPLSGGKLYSYEAGTTTPQTTYTDAAGTVAHTNPIVLNSAGRVATGEIWIVAGQNYKFVLKTSTEVTIATWDNITGINGTGITSNAINVEYDPAGANAVATNVQAKLRETFSVKDFGAVGNGAANDTTAIQNALNYLRDNGGTLVFPFGTYSVNAQLTLQRSSSGHAKRWVIEGNDSVIQSSFNGEIFVVGATDFIYFVEDGGTVINNLFINGSETVSGSSGVAPTFNQTGLYLYIAGNVNLNNVQSLKSRTGIRTHACFPLKAIDVSARGCWIGAHLDETSNLQDWDNFHAPNCRYSILIKSTTTTFDSGKSNNITFRKWWAEGSEVGMVVDSGTGGSGAVPLRSINVIEPYIAGIEYDIIRLGLQYDFATPAVRGAACSEFIMDLRFQDGLWNNTYSATSSAFAFDNSTRVRQCYIDVPIPSLDIEPLSWLNSPGGGTISARGLPSTAQQGRTTEYIYNPSGTLVQKQDYTGDIEFFGSTGIKFPITAGVYSSLFSDYEEGTFTPTIKGTSSAGTGTYVTQVGRYTKIGDRVLFDIVIAWSAHTGTGNMRIAGLPYTPNTAVFNSCAIGQFTDISLTAGTYASASVRDDVAEIQFLQLVVGGGAFGIVAMDGSGAIQISGSYEVA